MLPQGAKRAFTLTCSAQMHWNKKKAFGLKNQHDSRFILLENKYAVHDVTWKRSWISDLDF